MTLSVEKKIKSCAAPIALLRQRCGQCSRDGLLCHLATLSARDGNLGVELLIGRGGLPITGDGDSCARVSVRLFPSSISGRSHGHFAAGSLSLYLSVCLVTR